MSKEVWIKDVFAVDCEYGVSGKCKAYRGIDKEGYRTCLLIGQVDDMYFCPKLHHSKEKCHEWYKREIEKEKELKNESSD